MVSEEERAAAVARRWTSWLHERNRSGTRTLLFIVLALYPGFGAIDYLLAPRAALPWLWSTRVVVTLGTLVMFRLLRRPAFEQHHYLLASSYMLLCGAGITLMTLFMGGLASPYYAGLTLAVVATSLLFVWPPKVVIVTHGLMVLTYVVVNLWARRIGDLPTALMNLAFLSSTALIAGTGQIFGFRAQRAQMVAQLALEETTSELSSAHAQLRRQSEFKSHFFSNMTHELRTPLAMIVAPLELVLDGELGDINDAQRGSFQTMFKSSLKLLKLINDLLDLSKLEEARLELVVAEHDLVEHLESLIAQTQVLAQRKGIELKFFHEHPKQLVFGDLEKLERVFVNLLANAIKFTEPDGHVQVWLLDLQDSVKIVIEDDGAGFPPEQAEKLFERFFQVDMEGTRRHGGTGIGLALAKELVQLHGGTIEAAGRLGEGAKFTVKLRKGTAHLKGAVHAGEQKSTASQGLSDWAAQLSSRSDLKLLDIAEASDRRLLERDRDEKQRRHTCLVVEDTPDVVRLVHLALRRDFRVLAAPDGLKGLELALRERPSLIITDLMMPGIDGLELTRRLRADPITKAIPILMLTARADLEDRIAGLDSGASAYLAKPFSVKELLSCARRLVQERDKTAELVMTQKMDALEIVAAGLAHEINNPLNYVKNALGRVRGDADVLLEMANAASELLTAEQRSRLARVSSRVRDLLAVADSGLKRIGGTVKLMERYGQSGYSRVQRPHDVFAAVREVVELVLPATGRAVQVEPNLVGDGTVECVPEELNQVLTNLVQNAIEAVPEGGLVRLIGSSTANEVVLRVIDNGCGISSEDQARLFTPFFTTKGPGKGTGMGLSIVWRVMQAIGGTVEVVSQPGAGAEFALRIPRYQAGRVETPLAVKVLRAG